MTVLMFFLFFNKIVIFLCTLSKNKCKHKFNNNVCAENKICSCNGVHLRNQTLKVRNKSLELENNQKVMWSFYKSIRWCYVTFPTKLISTKPCNALTKHERVTFLWDTKLILEYLRNQMLHVPEKPNLKSEK